MLYLLSGKFWTKEGAQNGCVSVCLCASRRISFAAPLAFADEEKQISIEEKHCTGPPPARGHLPPVGQPISLISILCNELSLISQDRFWTIAWGPCALPARDNTTKKPSKPCTFSLRYCSLSPSWLYLELSLYSF